MKLRTRIKRLLRIESKVEEESHNEELSEDMIDAVNKAYLEDVIDAACGGSSTIFSMIIMPKDELIELAQKEYVVKTTRNDIVIMHGEVLVSKWLYDKLK